MNMSDTFKQSTIDFLMSQSIRVSVSHFISSIVFVFWLKELVPHLHLALWFGAISFICATRIALYFMYEKYKSDKHLNSLWMHTWAAVSVILGLTYSVAFIEFIPLDQPAYIISVAGFVIAFTSAAMIGYGGSMYGLVSFIAPLGIPPAIYLATFGGYYGSMAALAITMYAAMIITLIRPTISAFKKTNTLNYQLQKEIEKRILAEKQLQEISRRDSLTGLFNRRYFDEMLDVEIGRAYRNHSPLCLLMFDVDCFKEYNDKYGHVAGDNCLIRIAEIVESLTSRKGDLIARYGGEEFAVILPNIDLEGAVSFATKLQEGVQKQKIEHLNSKLTSLKSVTISVGVTNLTPFTKMTASQMIDAADRALYSAKRDGRNRVHHNANTGFDEGIA